MNIIRERYNSIHEFTHTILKRKNNRVMRNERSSERKDYEFTGTENMEEAIGLMENGYSEPLERIKKSIDKLKAKSNVNVQKARPSIGVVGYVPCVPNAILNLPYSMIKTDRVPTKIKVITMYYSVSVNAGTDKNTIIEAGVSILSILNELELHGYRVKLEVECIGAYTHKEFASASINLKDWRENLDIKKLTFPLVHPSFFRRMGFKWLETVPKLSDDDYACGYGRPMSNKGYEEAREFYNKNGICDEKTYYLNVPLCEEEEFDIKRIMSRCGIADLLKKEGKIE